MHEHDRLCERLVGEPVECRGDRRLFGGPRRKRQVAREKPLGEELHLARQQLAVVGRKRGRIARLQAHERVDRVRVQRLRIRALGKRVQVMLATEVAHQHEALLRVHGEHRRHVHAGRAEDARDPEPRVEAFALGRRVHRDLRSAIAVHAEIATKARVG